MTEETTIEFTDRYGGRPPSWLRGCHDQCEAMGWTPVFVTAREPGPDEAYPEDETDPRLLALWDEAHAKPHEEPCDGWHFVRCTGCDGSGRVSWLVTVTRSARWIVKGLRFYSTAMHPNISPPGWSWRRRFNNYLNAAFLSDIRNIRR